MADDPESWQKPGPGRVSLHCSGFFIWENMIRLNKNGKNRAAWDEKILEKYKNSFNYYVVSDSDLDLNNVPLDVLTILQNGLNKHKIYKAGLSIQIDDIPKNTITKGCAEYEKKYWLNSLDDHFYLAKVSTTFALYQFKEITKKWSLDAIRSKPPYTCKHIPWYITSNNITNEDIYYLKHLEYWTHWTFSRSVSMSFKFTSPYGNDLSIFENAYIPFILLFCMAMPRQIGAKTFTTPFIVRVNAKGMFSVPMGIIESMSIERGEDRNSWNTSDRPRTIKCNLSIKDITPTMMMTMNRGVFFPLFAGNDGFTSYLNTLGGLSIKDAGELQNTVKKFWTQMKTRLDSVSHFLTSVGGVGKSIAEGQPINAEDTSVITNFRNFPGVKQFTDFTRWTGIMSGTDNVLSRQGGDHH